MNNAHKEKLIQISTSLIDEANAVIESQFTVFGGNKHVEIQLLHKWWGKVKSFGYQLGSAANPWYEMFSMDTRENTLTFVKYVLGTLEAIKHELENDHLETVTQLVKAETLADLLDQAAHLYKNGYHLAAGVIGRAVLEEHLRTTCYNLDCSPSKPQPTINDFNQALYKKEHYNKIKMQQIEMLASIGNNAAHNNPALNSTEVKKLLTDLPEVIESTRS